MKMNDKTLRQYVVDELDWEPSVESAHIGVAVENGIVTLSGHIPNFAQKSAAEKAVRRVKGVRGIAEELRVDFGGPSPYLDDDIAKRALGVLDLNVLVPPGAIQVKVQQGWLTLTGEVRWDYQRTAAVADLRKLRGVTGISNNITLKPQVSAGNISNRIEDALKRHAHIEAKDVRVQVQDGRVTLEGRVPTWSDRRMVEVAAWAAPGVRTVEDHLRVI
ncbi:MAG TPA: BON domain-containing protein [Caulobacteraceae bacterium]